VLKGRKIMGTQGQGNELKINFNDGSTDVRPDRRIGEQRRDSRHGEGSAPAGHTAKSRL
jgi:hypothetical protein